MSYEVICSSDNRDEWLKARKEGIGASEAPVVLGVYPWKTPFELYAEKVSQATDERQFEAAFWGQQLEPLILSRFATETGRKVERGGKLLRSIDNPLMLATLDGTQVDSALGEGVVEIKATTLEDRWEDGPPPYVVAQVQHQLSVTGHSWASVAVLFSGRTFAFYDLERDDALISELVEREQEFWWRVLTNSPPELQGKAGEKEALARLFPKDIVADPVDLDAKFADLDEARLMLLDEQKRIKDELEAIDNQLKIAIGDHAAGKLPSGVLYTLKLTERAGYTVAPSSFRQLRRSKPKGAK